MTQLPGTSTDRLTRARVMSVRRANGYDVLETPMRRDFWFGNLLFSHEPLALDEREAWLDRHAIIFAGAGVRAHVVQWETADESGYCERCGQLPSKATYRFEHDRVLELRRLVTPCARPDVEVRAIVTDDDWAAAVALDVANRDEDDARAQDGFYRWRIGVDRASVERGSARVLGAFDGYTMLGYAGLYADRTWMRATTPNTARAARGRGIFSRLFAEVYAEARARYPSARCIIVAESDGAPERLYESLGFVPIGLQHSVVRAVVP